MQAPSKFPAVLQRWCYPLLLTAAVLLTFGGMIGHDFSDWDDRAHLCDNPHLAPAAHRSWGYFWQHGYFSEYVPLTYTFWLGEAQLSTWLAGQSPTGSLSPVIFQLGNLLLHLACVGLVFGLLKRLGCRPQGALGGALLFALHPLQVETVAWVSETRGLLATACSLVALGPFLRFSGGVGSYPSGKRKYLHYALATAAFALALLAKSSAVALPLVALAVHCGVTRGKSIRQMLAALFPWVLGGLAFVYVAKTLQPDAAMSFVTPWLERPVVAGVSLSFYLSKLLVPLNLCADYGLTPRWLLAEHWSYGLCLLPPLGGALAWRLAPLCRAPLAVFVAGVLPVLGLVAFSYQDISTVADRYVYLAMLGPAWLLGRWLSRPLPQICRWGAVAALLLLGIVGHQQVSYWSDTQSLFEHTLAINPQSAVAYNNLGLAAGRRGDLELAAADFRRALAMQVKQNDAIVQSNLGGVLLAQGACEEAANYLRQSIAARPKQASTQNNLGAAYRKLGRDDEAIACFAAAVEIEPDYADAHCNLANVLVRRGQLAAGIPHLERALAIDPGFAEAHRSLGVAELLRARRTEAEQHLARAIELKPHDPIALYLFGSFLAQQGRFAEAVDRLAEAVRVQPDCLEAHFNLALTLAQTGDTAAAREHFRECLRIKPDLEKAQQMLLKLDRLPPRTAVGRRPGMPAMR